MDAIFPPGRTIARRSLPALHAPAPAGAPPHAEVRDARVVALLDASPASVNAAWRAALVARDRRLALHLVALQGQRDPGALAAAETLARELREHLGVRAVAHAPVPGGGQEHPCLCPGAALLVTAAPQGAGLSTWLARRRALHWLRAHQLPVLLVRQPAAGSYRSVVAAVPLDAGARAIVAAAHALSRDPRMKVLHVLDTAHEETMRLADVPERVVQAQRERAALQAGALVSDVIAAAGAQRDGAVPSIGFGDPALRVLEQEVTYGADLLVLGKRPRPALVDALRGGVLPRVLAGARADVFILPLPRPQQRNREGR